MDTPNVLDMIREAHQVDFMLGRLAEAVGDDGLKARILEVREQWQPLAYEVSAHLCGMEPASVRPRKRRAGRRNADAAEAPAAGAEEPWPAES